MKRSPVSCLCLFLAACGGAPDGDDTGNVDAQPQGPTTLAEVGTAGQIVLSRDCIVVAQLTSLVCVPIDGGAVRPIATLPRNIVSVVADGDGVIATSLPLDFGPSGDRTMHVDRIALDGTVSELGTAFAGYGAGPLAVSADRIVFTTGGSASLLALPRTGGPVQVLGSDSGNFGSVAIGGNDAYYVNTSVYRHSLASTGGAGTRVETSGSITSVASDGTTVVAVGITPVHTAKLSIVSGTATAIDLAGMPSALVVAEGRAWMSIGGDVVSVDLATRAMTSVLGGQQAAGLIVAPTALYWITATGAVRTEAR